MTDIIHVPLSRLTLWDGNVRKTDIHAGIDELAQSIKAHGLLQSLVVRKGKRGKFEIVAGQRRYLALQRLVSTGDLAKDFTVPCALANDALDAEEISLAENVVRAPMHPADQFEAFRAIIDAGATVTDVAARFGITEAVVTRRLKLGRLSPVILDAYRKGDIDLEVAQAFAISDDHEAQERVLAGLPDWNRDPYDIRSALTTDEVPTSDKRVRYLGVDAYREAGGVIRQDLFSEEGEGFLADSVLLDRLVREKLSAESVDVSAEGWSWVDIVPDADYSFFAGFRQLYAASVELSDAEQSEVDRLSKEYDALAESDDADADLLQEIEQRIEELADREYWPADTLAVAGAILSINHRGELRIERGLVRKEDLHKLNIDAGANVASSSGRKSSPDGFSDRLVEDLSAQHTAAISAELMGRPDIALVAVVHALSLDAFYPGDGAGGCLQISAVSASLGRSISNPDDCKALSVIEQERERFGDRLPGRGNDLWAWLLARSRDELLDLLAFVAAMSVDGVHRKGDPLSASRIVHAKALGHALQLDMSNWFTPSADNYFGRISRAQILAAIDEATGAHAPALEKLKKSELTVRAEQLVSGTSWLPQPLRAAVNDNSDDRQSEAGE